MKRLRFNKPLTPRKARQRFLSAPPFPSLNQTISRRNLPSITTTVPANTRPKPTRSVLRFFFGYFLFSQKESN